MFERYVRQILEKSHFFDFFEGLDKKDVQIALWKGDVRLRRLVFKPEAFRRFNLPYNIVYGRIDEVRLSIPWKHLTTSSTQVTLNGFRLVLAPPHDRPFDYHKDAGDTKVKDVDLAYTAAKDKLKSFSSHDVVERETKASFKRMLVANLQITINDLHVRFENQSPAAEKCGGSFAIGVMMRNMSIVSTDSAGRSKFIRASEDRNTYKRISISQLGIYMDPMDATGGGTVEGPVPDVHQYILTPVDIQIDLRLCKTQYGLQMEIVMGSNHLVMIGWTKWQYECIMRAIESMVIHNQRRELARATLTARTQLRDGCTSEHACTRRDITLKRWQFAIACTRALLRNQYPGRFSAWIDPRGQLSLRQEYIGLYKKMKRKQSGLFGHETFTTEQDERRKHLEHLLVLGAVLYYRRIAEGELSIEKNVARLHRVTLSADSNSSKSSKKGGGLFRRKKKREIEKLDQATQGLFQTFQLNEDERKALVDQVNYDEIAVNAHVPEEYEKFVLIISANTLKWHWADSNGPLFDIHMSGQLRLVKRDNSWGVAMFMRRCDVVETESTHPQGQQIPYARVVGPVSRFTECVSSPLPKDVNLFFEVRGKSPEQLHDGIDASVFDQHTEEDDSEEFSDVGSALNQTADSLGSTMDTDGWGDSFDGSSPFIGQRDSVVIDEDRMRALLQSANFNNSPSDRRSRRPMLDPMNESPKPDVDKLLSSARSAPDVPVAKRLNNVGLPYGDNGVQISFHSVGFEIFWNKSVWERFKNFVRFEPRITGKAARQEGQNEEYSWSGFEFSDSFVSEWKDQRKNPIVVDVQLFYPVFVLYASPVQSLKIVSPLKPGVDGRYVVCANMERLSYKFSPDSRVLDEAIRIIEAVSMSSGMSEATSQSDAQTKQTAPIVDGRDAKYCPDFPDPLFASITLCGSQITLFENSVDFFTWKNCSTFVSNFDFLCMVTQQMEKILREEKSRTIQSKYEWVLTKRIEMQASGIKFNVDSNAISLFQEIWRLQKERKEAETAHLAELDSAWESSDGDYLDMNASDDNYFARRKSSDRSSEMNLPVRRNSLTRPSGLTGISKDGIEKLTRSVSNSVSQQLSMFLSNPELEVAQDANSILVDTGTELNENAKRSSRRMSKRISVVSMSSWTDLATEEEIVPLSTRIRVLSEFKVQKVQFTLYEDTMQNYVPLLVLYLRDVYMNSSSDQFDSERREQRKSISAGISMESYHREAGEYEPAIEPAMLAITTIIEPPKINEDNIDESSNCGPQEFESRTYRVSASAPLNINISDYTLRNLIKLIQNKQKGAEDPLVLSAARLAVQQRRASRMDVEFGDASEGAMKPSEKPFILFYLANRTEMSISLGLHFPGGELAAPRSLYYRIGAEQTSYEPTTIDYSLVSARSPACRISLKFNGPWKLLDKLELNPGRHFMCVHPEGEMIGGEQWISMDVTERFGSKAVLISPITRLENRMPHPMSLFTQSSAGSKGGLNARAIHALNEASELDEGSPPPAFPCDFSPAMSASVPRSPSFAPSASVAPSISAGFTRQARHLENGHEVAVPVNRSIEITGQPVSPENLSYIPLEARFWETLGLRPRASDSGDRQPTHYWHVLEGSNAMETLLENGLLRFTCCPIGDDDDWDDEEDDDSVYADERESDASRIFATSLEMDSPKIGSFPTRSNMALSQGSDIFQRVPSTRNAGPSIESQRSASRIPGASVDLDEMRSSEHLLRTLPSVGYLYAEKAVIHVQEFIIESMRMLPPIEVQNTLPVTLLYKIMGKRVKEEEPDSNDTSMALATKSRKGVIRRVNPLSMAKGLVGRGKNKKFRSKSLSESFMRIGTIEPGHAEPLAHMSIAEGDSFKISFSIAGMAWSPWLTYNPNIASANDPLDIGDDGDDSSEDEETIRRLNTKFYKVNIPAEDTSGSCGLQLDLKDTPALSDHPTGPRVFFVSCKYWIVDASYFGTTIGFSKNSSSTTKYSRARFGHFAPVIEEVYENERIAVSRNGWQAPYLPLDRHKWTDASGGHKRTKESVMLPSEQWHWTEDWQVDMSGICDEVGWRYKKEFNRAKYQDKKKWNTNVRIRRWIRVRAPVGSIYGGTGQSAGPWNDWFSKNGQGVWLHGNHGDMKVKIGGSEWSTPVKVTTTGVVGGILRVQDSTQSDPLSYELHVHSVDCAPPFSLTRMIVLTPYILLANNLKCSLYLKQAHKGTWRPLAPGEKCPMYWSGGDPEECQRMVRVMVNGYKASGNVLLTTVGRRPLLIRRRPLAEVIPDPSSPGGMPGPVDQDDSDDDLLDTPVGETWVRRGSTLSSSADSASHDQGAILDVTIASRDQTFLVAFSIPLQQDILYRVCNTSSVCFDICQVVDGSTLVETPDQNGPNPSIDASSKAQRSFVRMPPILVKPASTIPCGMDAPYADKFTVDIEVDGCEPLRCNFDTFGRLPDITVGSKRLSFEVRAREMATELYVWEVKLKNKAHVATSREASRTVSSAGGSSMLKRTPGAEKIAKKEDIDFQVSIPHLGFSYIDHVPDETMYISIGGISVSFLQKGGTTQAAMHFSVDSFNIANQASGAVYTRLLNINPPDETKPCIDLYVCQDNYYLNMKYIPLSRFSIGEISFKADWLYLQRLVTGARRLTQYFKSATGVAEISFDEKSEFNMRDWCYDHLEKTIGWDVLTDMSADLVGKMNRAHKKDVAVSQKKIFYFKDFRVSDINVVVTIMRANVNQRWEGDDAAETRSILAIANSVFALDGAKLKFSALHEVNMKLTPAKLMGIRERYYMELIAVRPALLGAAEVVGISIPNLSRRFDKGVSDFGESVRSLVKNPLASKDLFLTQGTTSLFSNTFGGIAGLTGDITKTIGDGAAVMSMDRAYRIKRDRRFEEKAGGLKSLRGGVVSGVKGVVTQPWKGFKRDGAKGAVIGLAAGVTGIAAKPVSGLMDATASYAHSWSKSLDSADVESWRVRPHRAFYGPHKLIRPFTPIDASIYTWMLSMTKNKSVPGTSRNSDPSKNEPPSEFVADQATYVSDYLVEVVPMRDMDVILVLTRFRLSVFSAREGEEPQFNNSLTWPEFHSVTIQKGTHTGALSVFINKADAASDNPVPIVSLPCSSQLLADSMVALLTNHVASHRGLRSVFIDGRNVLFNTILARLNIYHASPVVIYCPKHRGYLTVLSDQSNKLTVAQASEMNKRNIFYMEVDRKNATVMLRWGKHNHYVTVMSSHHYKLRAQKLTGNPNRSVKFSILRLGRGFLMKSILTNGYIGRRKDQGVFFSSSLAAVAEVEEDSSSCIPREPNEVDGEYSRLMFQVRPAPIGRALSDMESESDFGGRSFEAPITLRSTTNR